MRPDRPGKSASPAPSERARGESRRLPSRTSGDADDGDTGSNVLRDDRAGPDDGPFADPTVLKDLRSRSDQDPLFEYDPSGDVRPWVDDHAASERGLVANRRPEVDERECPQGNVHGQHRAAAYEDPLFGFQRPSIGN